MHNQQEVIEEVKAEEEECKNEEEEDKRIKKR